jgi:hypothetical protein
VPQGIEGSTERYLQGLAHDDVLGEPDWDVVQHLTDLETSPMLRNLLDMRKSRAKQLQGQGQQGGKKAAASIVLGPQPAGGAAGVPAGARASGRGLLRGMARVSADVAARFAGEDDAAAFQGTLVDLRCR